VPGSPAARFLLLDKPTVTNKFPEIIDQVKVVANPVSPEQVGDAANLIVVGGVILK
jgi:hypothetical protein